MGRQSDLDNHANQLNPNNDVYWQSRGYDERSDECDEETPESDTKSAKSQRPETKSLHSKK